MLAPERIMFDVEKIRKDFPILTRSVNHKPLIYLDSAATSQKPKIVIDSITHFYEYQNANIHRGVHTLSQELTSAYEDARDTIKNHLNAKFSSEIIFTKGTTDSINLVATSLGKNFLIAGDEIIITAMEHHSNIIPWQMLRDEIGVVLKVAPINQDGELIKAELFSLINSKTKLISLCHISNTLGTVNPVKEIIEYAHQKNVLVLIDGAQAVPHLKVDVQDLDADFYVFSGHKLFGPTGVGILYAKEGILAMMPPYQGGGGIIKTVSFEKTVFADAPQKFEAGTPNIEGGIGLAAAINYVNEIGLDKIEKYEHELLQYATRLLTEIDSLQIIGNAKQKAGVISFIVKGIHPFDIGTILDKQGIAVRTGHHCTQPLMQFYNIPGTIRASFAFYNTKEEIDIFILALKKAIKMLQ